ncbi:hypothetical protein HPP92_017981 [Vanilla planifolia]|uniref:Peptidase A1 domain-containing protein n=1 Tax=Vanilla planifolia TaxID=51239 RepID=A0A835Q4Y0_VANPL|nr:hypothetical protein HPP92_017981 [Vanilla planifolia]
MKATAEVPNRREGDGLLPLALYIRRPRGQNQRATLEMELLPSLCFLLLLVSAVAPLMENPMSTCASQIEAKNDMLSSSGGIHFPLYHRRRPCASASPLPDEPAYRDILRQDEHRYTSLVLRLNNTATAAVVSVPLSHGTALGVGNYVAVIHIGTPPKAHSVVVDTGSSLSWIQCLPCKASCHRQVDPVFDPTASSTYHHVPCSSATCSALSAATLNPFVCDRRGDCVYEATYGDNSFSIGYLSRDTLSLSGGVAVPRFVFGCGQDNEGLFGESAGLIGLAKNSLSLLSQLSAAGYGRSFSYCLPTKSGSGYLAFGHYNAAGFTFTPMGKSSLDETLYFLRLTGIAVAGRRLSVSTAILLKTPTMIDSGTVITRLPEEVYSALSRAVVAAVGRKTPRAAAYSILDTCYKRRKEDLRVPEVDLMFDEGAVVRLPAGNVMLEVEKGTTCLAFSAASKFAIIGNWQQQTFRVVYDVGKMKLGFAAGGCR